MISVSDASVSGLRLMCSSLHVDLKGCVRFEMPDDEETVEDSEDIKNDEWLKQNYLDLVQDYPNRWIAVLDQKVLCSGNRRGSVELEAKEIAGNRAFSLYFIEPSGILP